MIFLRFYTCITAIFLAGLCAGQQPRLVLPIGHTGRIQSASYSPDGKYIVTTAYDKTAKIWKSSTGELLMEILKPDIVNRAGFSPDGKYIAICWGDNIFDLSISNAFTGETVMEVENAYLATFSPDSKHVLTGNINYAKTWDIVSGKLIKELPGLINLTTSVAYSPDGKSILVSGKGHSILYDAGKGEIIREIQGGEAHYSPNGGLIMTTDTLVSKVWNTGDGKLIGVINGFSGKFDPSGKYITSISHDPTQGPCINIVDAVTQKLLKQLKGYEERITNIDFSPDGQFLLSGSNDKQVRIWNLKEGSLVRIKDHGRSIITAMFSPDGNYFIVATESNCNTWNALNGNLQQELKGYTSYVCKAEFSPAIPDDRLGGKHILIATGGDNIARIWGANTGQPELKLKGHTDYLASASYSPDGKFVVTASSDHTAIIWDATTGKIVRTLSGHTKDLYDAKYSPDGKYIATASLDNTVGIWNAQNGEVVSIIKGEPFQSVFFDASGKNLLTTDFMGFVINWNIADGTMIWKAKAFIKFLGNAVFSSDGKLVSSASSYQGAELLNATDGKRIRVFGGHSDMVYCVAFDQDNKYVITGSLDNSAMVWDATTGKMVVKLSGHISAVNSVMFSPSGKRILTGSADNTAKIWDMPSGKLQATFIAVNENDYLTQISSGYYQSSINAARLLHYVTKDLNVISFEQLDVKYNRPDKVLEAIGNTDTALIKSYRKAWKKRIIKLGIDTTAFRDGYSVPEADFTNREAIEYEQKTGTLKLLIKGNDSTYKLDRFNVWVNESPVFGQRGISIRRRNKNDFDTTITIKLSQGENRIETSITNVNGTESYRMPLTVNYTPAVKQKESVRFIGIGIDQFADNKYNLQYSAKDIRDLSKKLKEKYKEDIIIDTLFNQNVTVSNVKALKQKLQATTENDKVIIAYSGHGMLSKDYDYYLSTYSVNFDKPEQNGLPYDELENLLDSIPTRKKLMLIDACHSGEVDKEDLITLNASNDSLIKGLKPVAYKKEGQLGLKNSFELMQSLFVNVGKSTGATIISAAAGTQFALERNDLKNGVFTYSILEAMNKYSTLKISELKKIVGERVEQLTKGLQKPTSRNETIAVDWNLW